MPLIHKHENMQMCLRFIIWAMFMHPKRDRNRCKYVRPGLILISISSNDEKRTNRQAVTKTQLIIMMMKGANKDQTDVMADLIVCWCNLTGIHHIIEIIDTTDSSSKATAPHTGTKERRDNSGGFVNADRLGKVYSQRVALLFAAQVGIVQWVTRNVVRTTLGTLMSWRHVTKYACSIAISTMKETPVGVEGLLNDQHLYHLANRLGNDWERLGVLLRIDRAVIEHVAYDFRWKTVLITYELLKIWRDSEHQGKDNTGMFDEMCTVVKETGRNYLVETINYGISAHPASAPNTTYATPTSEGRGDIAGFVNADCLSFYSQLVAPFAARIVILQKLTRNVVLTTLGTLMSWRRMVDVVVKLYRIIKGLHTNIVGSSNKYVLLNDEYLLTLAQRLGNVHILLGGLLRVESVAVWQIQYNSKNLVDITHNVLKTWRDDARWRMKDIGMAGELRAVGELCAAFSTLERNDVVGWITSYVRSQLGYNAVEETGHKLPRCEVLEDPFMCRLARDLGSVHFQLGSLLRIDPAVIEQIVYDYKRMPEITFQLLVRWRDDIQKNSNTVTMVDELCTVFTDLSRSDIVENINSDKYV